MRAGQLFHTAQLNCHCTAAVMVGAAISPPGLLAGVRAHLDPFKVPKDVIVVDELPRTSTGKVQKNVLRDRYAGLPAR